MPRSPDLAVDEDAAKAQELVRLVDVTTLEGEPLLAAQAGAGDDDRKRRAERATVIAPRRPRAARRGQLAPGMGALPVATAARLGVRGRSDSRPQTVSAFQFS